MTTDLPARRANQLSLRDQADRGLSSACAKNLGVPLRHKGRTRRHERGAECGGREGAGDVRRSLRTAKSCGPGAPMQAPSPREAEKLRAGNGGKRWFIGESTL